MCNGDGAAKRAAAQQRSDEQERQSRIQKGQRSIDEVFDSTYTPEYYDNIKKSYTDYYNPQVDKQYNDTLEKLTFNLGRQGILQSDEAGKQFGDLSERFNQEKGNIGNQALEAVQRAKGNVSQERNTLYSLNNTTADPSVASAQARQALSSITTQPSMTSLGNLFANFINNAGAAGSVVAQKQGYINQPGFNLDNSSRQPSVVYN